MVGPHRAPPERREFEGTRWYYLQVQWLEWKLPTAYRVLEGDMIANLLAPSYVLLGGQHRPLWHPRLGIDDVELAFFPWPPANISPVELMVKLIGSTRRS